MEMPEFSTIFEFVALHILSGENNISHWQLRILAPQPPLDFSASKKLSLGAIAPLSPPPRHHATAAVDMNLNKNVIKTYVKGPTLNTKEC